MNNYRMVLIELTMLTLLLSWSEQAHLQSPHSLSKRSLGLCSDPNLLGCPSSKGTPAFYSHCIQKMFPCRDNNFALLSYAKLRITTIVNQLDPLLSQDPAARDLQNYLHKTELCFQNELESATRSLAKSTNPSPHHCLALETQALTLLNQCYKPDLCQVLDKAEDRPKLEANLAMVVEAFRLGGDYFNSTMVDSGLPLAIEECGHPQLAQSLVSTHLPIKVNWCATGKNFKTRSVPSPSEFIAVLSSKLNRSVDQFVYSGLDNPNARMCSTAENQHVISWLADYSDSLVASVHNLSAIEFRDLDRYFEFSAHEEVAPSQCGDGVRQVGEMCDYLDNLEACNASCAVRENYQCSIAPLVPSQCTQAPATTTQVECISRTRGRSRAGIQSGTLLSPSGPSLTGGAGLTRTLSVVTLVLLALLSLTL